MAQCLVEVSEIGRPKESVLYLSKNLPKIHHLRPSVVAAPTSNLIYRCGGGHPDTVFFKEFDDRVDVLPSLQRPKKLNVVCSDGRRRTFLCKPKDDLRKDMRFLELASVANTFFQIGSRILVYAVVPLNEDTGVIEWVDETVSLRAIMQKTYKDIGISINYPELRELQKSEDFSTIFTEKVLPR